MAVHFQARDSTADVDAVIAAPVDENRALVRQVAEEFGWAANRLNDAAKPYLVCDSTGPILFTEPGILVRSVALEQLLAMKLMAWRDDVDFGDAEVILRELTAQRALDISSPDGLLKLIEPYLVDNRKLKACYALEELLEIVDAATGEDSPRDPRGGRS